MTRESTSSPYNKLVKRITFNDEQTVRKGGGTPTDVEFSDGKGDFNGTSSKVNYDLGLNGTYSVRIRCNPTSFAGIMFLLDTRGTDGNGAGYVSLLSPSGNMDKSSGTSYVNGVATTTPSVGVDNEIVITGITLTQGTGANLSVIGARYNNTYEFLGTMDLVEIYAGTLTASEVSNLYNDTWNKEQVFSGSYKSPLIKDGDLDFTTGWLGIGGGSATTANSYTTTSNGGVTDVDLLEINKKYLVTMAGSTTATNFYLGQSTSGVAYSSTHTTGNFEETFTFTPSISNSLYFRNTGAGVTTLTTFEIQELNPKTLIDFDSTGGAIEDKCVGNPVGGDLIINGDFTQGATGWTVGSSWSITDGVASHDGSGATYLKQDSILTVGRKYLVTVRVQALSSDSSLYVTSGWGANNICTLTTDNIGSIQTGFITAGSINLSLYGSSGKTGSVNNITIHEIRPDLDITNVNTVKSGSNYSALFDGSSSKIDLGTDCIGVKAITVMGWIKPYSYGNINGRILDNGKAILFLYNTNGTLGFVSTGVGANLAADNAILLNQWNFVATTRESDGTINHFIGYKNTAPVLSGTPDLLSGTPTAGTTNVILGNNSNQSGTFDGLIPKLGVVESILSLAEITRAWSSSRGSL